MILISRSSLEPGWYIEARRWPWQKAGHTALLNSAKERAMSKYGWLPTDGMGRFGGGWNWKLGVSMGHLLPTEHGWSVHFDLLFGTLDIGYRSVKSAELNRKWKRERQERLAKPPVASF